MKKLIAVVAASSAALAASSAFAQDANQFSGPYVGVVAGVQQSKSVAHDGDQYLTYGDLTATHTGALVGGELGYNYQAGSLVLGLEADLSFANAKSRAEGWDRYSYAASKQKWNGSIRARAGVAVGNVMPFVTGGLAVARTRYEANYDSSNAACDVSGVSSDWVCDTRTQTGFVVGAGVEGKASDRVSVKLEYLHTKMPSHTAYLYDDYPIQFSNSSDAVRLGMNFHF